MIPYTDILKQYGIEESELPESAKRYIQKKHNSLRLSQQFINVDKGKVNPEAPDEKLNKKIERAEAKHLELIAQCNKEINREVVEACEEIKEQREKAPIETPDQIAAREAQEAADKVEADRIAAEEAEKKKAPPAKRKFFGRLYKEVEDK